MKGLGQIKFERTPGIDVGDRKKQKQYNIYIYVYRVRYARIVYRIAAKKKKK